MSAYIKKRRIADDPVTKKQRHRYYVYYRRSTAHGERYAGSFRNKKDAQTRVDLIRGELAALRDPAILLKAVKKPVAAQPGLRDAYERWRSTRKDVTPGTAQNYVSSQERWTDVLGARTRPDEVTVDMILAGVDEMLDELKAGSVKQYLSTLAQVLDFCDISPNPARSKKIRLPSSTAEKEIPSNQEWSKILAVIAARSRDAVRVMECAGFRVSEACGIQEGDKDTVSGMVLVRRSVTKTRAGRRWVPLPPELINVFPLGLSPGAINYDLEKACERAGTRRFTSHAFRHRRISLWYRQGIDPVQVSRWAGHSKSSEGLDTYGHTVVDALEDEWFSWWQAVYAGSSAAPVRHGEGVEL